jgi:hypothetical protein
MKNYQKVGVLLIFAALVTLTVSQTVDDDEVDTAVPGYPHKFYSGMCIDILRLPSTQRSGFKISSLRIFPFAKPAIR